MAYAGETGCFTLKWRIENFGIALPLKESNCLISPLCKIDAELWTFCAVVLDSKVYFKLECLTKEYENDRCELFFISSCKEIPMQKNINGSYAFEINVITDDNRPSILPQNTFTVVGKIWSKQVKTGKSCICSALQKSNFIWNIEKFKPSSFYSNTFRVEGEQLLLITLDKKSENGTHTVIVGTISGEKWRMCLLDCKISINGSRAVVIFEEYKSNKLRYSIENFPRSQSNILFNIEIICELQKIPIVSYSEGAKCVIQFANSSPSTTLPDELLHLYREKTLTDATLKTEGKSFSAHRSILAARSEVFRSMFEKEQMSEARSGVVDIDDIDSATVDRMLVFVYGDTVEGLQWPEAASLYYAADKYSINTLKSKCINLLKSGLDVTNVCDALVLADKHADEELMRSGVDFVRDHQEVTSSKDWENLEDSNPKLILKIVREIYYKKENK